MTHIAKLGSNQLSLETPQNKVGELVCSRCRFVVFHGLLTLYIFSHVVGGRVRPVDFGQGCELGEAGVYVAHDFRCVLHFLSPHVLPCSSDLFVCLAL